MPDLDPAMAILTVRLATGTENRAELKRPTLKPQDARKREREA